jgi:hypothetical protein
MPPAISSTNLAHAMIRKIYEQPECPTKDV